MPADNDDPFAEKSSWAELSSLEEWKLFCLPFKGQRWYHQLLVLGVAIALWIGAFWLTITYTGDWSIVELDSAAGAEARRRGAIVASAVTSTYFAVALVYGYGGPVLAFAVYPAVTHILMHSVIVPRWFGTGSLPYIAPDRGGLPPRLHIDYFPIYAAMGIPYLLAIIIVVIIADERDFARYYRNCHDAQVRLLGGMSYDQSDPHTQQVIRDAGYDPDEETSSDEHPCSDTDTSEETTQTSRGVSEK